MTEITAQSIDEALKKQLEQLNVSVESREVGTVIQVGDGIARVDGLRDAMAGELLEFIGEGGKTVYGLAQNLEEDEVGAVLLGDVTAIREKMADADITAVGTNTVATAAMLKAGADNAATGENAVVVNTRRADVIVGPIGIVIADAMFGEITPRMANAVAQSSAKRILIPINHCDNIVVGVVDLNIGRLIQCVIEELCRLCDR